MENDLIIEYFANHIEAIVSIFSMLIMLGTAISACIKGMDLRPAQLMVLRGWKEKRKNYIAYKLFVLVLVLLYNASIMIMVVPSNIGDFLYEKVKWSILVALVFVICSVVAMFILFYCSCNKKLNQKESTRILIYGHVIDAFSIVAINILALEKNVRADLLIILYGILMALILTMMWDVAILRPLYNPGKARGWVKYKGKKLYILDDLGDNYLLGENAYIEKNALTYCVSKTKIRKLKIHIDQVAGRENDDSKNNVDAEEQNTQVEDCVSVSKNS